MEAAHKFENAGRDPIRRKWYETGCALLEWGSSDHAGLRAGSNPEGLLFRYPSFIGYVERCRSANRGFVTGVTSGTLSPAQVLVKHNWHGWRRLIRSGGANHILPRLHALLLAVVSRAGRPLCEALDELDAVHGINLVELGQAPHLDVLGAQHTSPLTER